MDSAAAALSISGPALLEVVDKSLPTAAGLAGAPTQALCLQWCVAPVGEQDKQHTCTAWR